MGGRGDPQLALMQCCSILGFKAGKSNRLFRLVALIALLGINVTQAVPTKNIFTSNEWQLNHTKTVLPLEYSRWMPTDECKDQSIDCISLGRGQCGYPVMRDMCPSTCYVCTIPKKECQNHNVECEDYVNQRRCDVDVGFINACPVSCDTCTPYSPITDDDCRCGIANNNNHWNKKRQNRNVSETRIVGGDEAVQHKYPWLVILRINRYGYKSPSCGGSLINELYVLTAAHCTKKCTPRPWWPEDIIVTVAEHNLNNQYESKAATDYNVVEIIPHEKYCLSSNINPNDNDIALLKLSHAVDLFAREVGIICLAPQGFQVADNAHVIAAGWGNTDENGQNGDGGMSSTVREVLLTTDDCTTEEYRKVMSPYIPTENMICAGDRINTLDACNGDSGGPLMILDSQNIIHQIGVVSYGPSSLDCKGYGIYTKLAHYTDWILKNTRDATCQHFWGNN